MSETRPSKPPDDAVEPEEADEQSPFDELPDGSGCAEIWEHLSRQRREE